MNPSEDHPDIIARPPLIYAGALLAVFLLRWFWPLTMADTTFAHAAGAALIVLGFAFGIPGRIALATAGTHVDPMRPTTTVVQRSSYRFSRNPLYVGLTIVFVGIGLIANTAWVFVILIPLSIAMHVGVILREEDYLAQKFGEPYRRYCERVRRYL